MNVWHGFLIGGGASPPPQLGLPGQNIATWPVLSPWASPKREMKGLAKSPPGPGQADTAVPIHPAHGACSGRFPQRGKALRQLFPFFLPTQKPNLSLSLPTNLEDKDSPVRPLRRPLLALFPRLGFPWSPGLWLCGFHRLSLPGSVLPSHSPHERCLRRGSVC